MTAAVALPIWALLLLVAATPLAGWMGARQGAKQAIAMCSAHWGCAMRQDERRAQNTQDLQEQYDALQRAHPELAVLRKAANDAIKDTGDHPAITDRSRAKPDEDGRR